MRFLRKVSSIAPIAIALSLLTALPATAASPPPPSLVGEILDSTSAAVFTLNCAPDGSGTISWQASGTATGPYPGTFTETGSVTIAPGTDAGSSNAVTSVQASFVITSPVGTVRGSKSLNPVDVFNGALGTCQRSFSSGYPALISVFQSTVRYEATITTSDSVYAETGLGSLNGYAITNLPASPLPDSGEVQEQFLTTTSGGPVFVALLTPTSVDQCKKDAYKQYQIFKNQGDCVAFIQTAGTNEPGQNIPGS